MTQIKRALFLLAVCAVVAFTQAQNFWGVQATVALADNGDGTTKITVSNFDFRQMTGVSIQVSYFDLPQPLIPNDKRLFVDIPLAFGPQVNIPLAMNQIRIVTIHPYKEVGFQQIRPDGTALPLSY